MDGIGACICCFCNHITCIINHIGVITSTTNEGVCASSTIQGVVAAVAGDGVIEGIASSVDRSSTCQRQVFNVCAKGVGDGGLNGVGSCIECFYNGIACTNEIGVITQTTREGICCRISRQNVV